MRNVNFLPRFAEAVKTGAKRQTIRKRGKQKPPEVGDALMLYTGLRTLNSRALRTATVTSVECITISCATRYVAIARPAASGVLAFSPLNEEEVEQLARDDGFYNADEFFRFFQEVHGGGLAGYVLKWD